MGESSSSVKQWNYAKYDHLSRLYDSGGYFFLGYVVLHAIPNN